MFITKNQLVKTLRVAGGFYRLLLAHSLSER